jgi:hypothetical protein
MLTRVPLASPRSSLCSATPVTFPTHTLLIQVYVDVGVTLSSMQGVSSKVPQCMGLLATHLASHRHGVPSQGQGDLAASE